MTGTEGGATPPATPPAAPRTTPGAEMWSSLSRSLQLAVIGAAVAGLYGLLRVFDPVRFGSEQAGAIVAAAALAVIFLAIRRGRAAGAWYAVLAALGLALLILAALDLWALLEDLDDADDYGGGLALPGRIVYLAGAAALAIGSWGAWMSQGGTPATFLTGVARGHTPDRLFAGGALLLVLGWIGMIVLGTGWELNVVASLAIAAAVVALVAREASGAISAGVYRVVLVVLAAAVAWATILALGDAIDAWDLIVGVAGPLTYLPFIVSVAGAVMMAAGAVMSIMNAQAAPATPPPAPPDVPAA